MFFAPKPNAVQATCGCNFSNSDIIFNSLHHFVTFLFIYFVRKSLQPITAPKCLFASVIMVILVSLSKRSVFFNNVLFLRTSQDLLSLTWRAPSSMMLIHHFLSDSSYPAPVESSVNQTCFISLAVIWKRFCISIVARA